MQPEAFALMEDLSRTYWWYRARREIICDTVVRNVAPGGEVADYGCGSGATADALRTLGFQVTAADISERCLALCRENGFPTVDLNRERLPAARSDCVLLCDVLEHVQDDVGLLTELRAALRPGGRILVTVPAYDILWSGEDFISGHVRRYTRRRLRQALTDAGFTIQRCGYFNTLLLPPIFGVLLGKRVFSPRSMYSSDLQPLPKWLNGLLYRVFALERWPLRAAGFPWGASILAIGKTSAGPAPAARRDGEPGQAAIEHASGLERITS